MAGNGGRHDAPSPPDPVPLPAGRLIDGTSAVGERQRVDELRGVLESTADGLLVVGRDGRVIVRNACFGRMWRIPPALLADGDDAALLAFVLDQLVEPERFLAKVRTLYATDAEDMDELRFKDGRIFERYSRALLLQGAVVGRVWSFRDVSERKRAEAALQRSEEKYRGLIETTDTGVVVLGAGGQVVDANATYVKVTGRASLTDVLGRRVDEWTAPYDRERNLTAVHECLARGTVRNLEIDYVAVDGRTTPVEINATVVRGVDGLQILSLVRDITERRRAEAQRLEMERRLLHAQKLESLGVLAGGIAHDFNNLLMAILGNLDMALLDLPPGAAARASIEPAIRATQRATDLTLQLLAYSGRGRVAIARMDLNDLVRENVELFRAAVARTVTFRLDLAASPCGLEADAGQVQQVIMNLITNASEAIGDGPGVITLTTGVLDADAGLLGDSRQPVKPPPGRFAWVAVADTGCGMDPNTQQRLFEPFFSTKFTGRGLGMSAVLGIMQAHCGAILVDSAVGRGTTVRVLFPACDVTAVAVPPASPATGRGGCSRTILVIDDEDDVREVGMAQVERLGFRGVGASNGREGLAVCARHGDEIAGVILDFTMPQLDGLGTFRELRRMRPGLPVILCSGYSESEAMGQFAGESLAGFLKKPYRLRDLEAALRRALPSDDGAGGS